MVTKKEIGNLKMFGFVSLLAIAKIIKPMIELAIGLIMIPFLPIQFIWWLFTKKGFFEVGIYGLLQRTIDKIQD